MKQCNPPEEISLIYIHMQISILRKKDILLKGRRKGEKEREGSSAYHHSTDVQTKCVGLSVLSLRLSGAKLQRWPVWMDQVNQLQLRKNISIVAVICSDGRGGKSQRIRMRTFSCQRPSAKQRKFIFQVDTVKALCCRIVLEPGSYSRKESAEWTVTELWTGPLSFPSLSVDQKNIQKNTNVMNTGSVYCSIRFENFPWF